MSRLLAFSGPLAPILGLLLGCASADMGAREAPTVRDESAASQEESSQPAQMGVGGAPSAPSEVEFIRPPGAPAAGHPAPVAPAEQAPVQPAAPMTPPPAVTIVGQPSPEAVQPPQPAQPAPPVPTPVAEPMALVPDLWEVVPDMVDVVIEADGTAVGACRIAIRFDPTVVRLLDVESPAFGRGEGGFLVDRGEIGRGLAIVHGYRVTSDPPPGAIRAARLRFGPVGSGTTAITAQVELLAGPDGAAVPGTVRVNPAVILVHRR